MPAPERVSDAVLDSEALSVLANPDERGATRRRARVVARALTQLHATALIPAPVIAEVRRGSRGAAIDRILNQHQVVDTDSTIAARAGHLLHHHGLGAAHTVDALVASTAAAAGEAVILTGDVDDMERLVERYPNVVVRSIL